MRPRNILITGIVLAVVGVGVLDYRTSRNEGDTVAKPRREPTSEMLKQRGPRPTENRLRDGEKQIEDPAQALDLAERSLVRVNDELARATGNEERARLEKKKKLIEEAIARLTSR